MSIITLQIGQCGNQIGEKLFETIVSDCFDINKCNQKSKPSLIKRTSSLGSLNIAERELNLGIDFNRINNEYVFESKRRFFTQVDHQDECELKQSNTNESDLLYARSILIDMESKVINKLIYSNESNSNKLINSKWKYREENCYTQKKGSGNNWSYGYCINAPKSREQVENKIRKEAEKCDRLSSFMVMMSMAGGTGSGVGSYYTELLSDLYERVTICNSCIWPFKSGEVTLQNYNFLLTLSKLYEASQSIILIENDILNQICKRIYSQQKREITFNDLNSIVGHKLASLMQPCNYNDSTKQSNFLDEIIGELCPNSNYKLLSLNNVPQMSKESIEFSTHKWPSLYRNVKQLLFTGGYMDEGLNWNNQQLNPNENLNKSIGLCLFARGDIDMDPKEQQELVNSTFDQNYLNKYFSTNLYNRLPNQPVKIWLSKRQFNNYDKSLTLLSNSQLPAFKIDTLVSKAWNMYTSKAYLHHYIKYDNFEEQSLLNSFIFAEQLIKNYKNI